MRTKSAYTLIELLCVVALISILAAIAVPNFREAQVRTKVSRMEADMAVVASALRAYYADYNRYPPNHPLVDPFLRACIGVQVVNGKTVPTPEKSTISWTIEDYDQYAPLALPPSELFPGPFLGAPMRADLETSHIEVYDSPGRAPMNPLQSRRPDNPPFGEGALISRYPVLDLSGWALAALTTPLPYYSQAVPLDAFHSRRGTPLLYVNYLDILPEERVASDGGRLRRYLLLSYGPNTDASRPDFHNPLHGPFIPYDPTNGTVSEGDIFLFGY